MRPREGDEISDRAGREVESAAVHARPCVGFIAQPFAGLRACCPNYETFQVRNSRNEERECLVSASLLTFGCRPYFLFRVWCQGVERPAFQRPQSAYGGQTHGTVEGSEWGEVNPQPAPSGSANWIRSRRALEAMQPVFGSDRTSRFCDQSSGLRSPR